MPEIPPQTLLVTCGAWHLPHTAQAFSQRGALAEFWLTDRCRTAVPMEKVRRCWPFHLAMKPFYRFAPQIVVERLFYAFLPIWQQWIRRQRWPQCEVVQTIVGFGTEAFDYAERIGALKVIDCPNSHPVSFQGIWQRECDLWCPGEKVPIPSWMIARMGREIERADVILVQSKFCKETMVSNGVPPVKVVVSPMGVDTTVFKKRTVVPKKVRFVTVGTICLRKGHQYLFRAWERVKKVLPDAELICVGDYKCDFRLERAKWEGTFTHAQNLTHPELADLLQTCTAFVFPSQEEGIARAQMEALAVGLPVIGTHEGGTTTVVEDGVEGFIVRGQDPDQIAERMLRIAAAPELNQAMGEAAIQRSAGDNSWQHYGDRLLNEYSQRLKTPHAFNY